MERLKIVTCRICLKTMISDNLKRHMKQHEIKPSLMMVTEKIEYHSTVNVDALKNNIAWKANEFRMKIELERVIKQLCRK